MDALQVALVVLVSAWTLISVALGIAGLLVFHKINEALDRLNALLTESQQMAADVSAPVRAVAESVREVFGPASSVKPMGPGGIPPVAAS